MTTRRHLTPPTLTAWTGSSRCWRWPPPTAPTATAAATEFISSPPVHSGRGVGHTYWRFHVHHSRLTHPPGARRRGPEDRRPEAGRRDLRGHRLPAHLGRVHRPGGG